MFLNEISTGASDDLKKATRIARSMVTEYGMSDLGPMQLEQQEGSVFLGRDYNKSRNFSNEVAHEIDTEMRKIHDRLPIEYVNRFDYQADGGTALYDSLVKQIIEFVFSFL